MSHTRLRRTIDNLPVMSSVGGVREGDDDRVLILECGEQFGGREVVRYVSDGGAGRVAVGGGFGGGANENGDFETGGEESR